MQLALPGQPHLTYCTNIHAGESWSEIKEKLAEHLPAIKARVSPTGAMGLGLRLSALAASELSEPAVLAEFKRFLADHNIYVVTVNAFPYGVFHNARVKEKVYEPDWRAPERLAFTSLVADVLAELAPVGLETSISTVPGAFRSAVAPADIAVMTEAFVRAAAHLHDLVTTRGRTIVLALEPEPACFLETTDDAVRFFEQHLFSMPARTLFMSLTGTSALLAEAALRRHLGLCMDVCHAAVAFEDMAESVARVRAAGIRIAKVQLSSAIKIPDVAAGDESELIAFDDGIYLHQTVERRDGKLNRHVDLPDALAALRRGEAGGEWRVHCHVPIFLESFGPLGSTQDTLRDLLSLCREGAVSPHLEVETYTWNVLPSALREVDVANAIARELEWVRAELRC